MRIRFCEPIDLLMNQYYKMCHLTCWRKTSSTTNHLFTTFLQCVINPNKSLTPTNSQLSSEKYRSPKTPILVKHHDDAWEHHEVLFIFAPDCTEKEKSTLNQSIINLFCIDSDTNIAIHRINVVRPLSINFIASNVYCFHEKNSSH